MNKHKMSIVIGSCDAYSDIASLYIKFLRKYWDSCSYPIYVSLEKKIINESGVISVTCEKKLEWAKRVVETICKTDSKYIWLTVDDLFLCSVIDNKRIESILNFMDAEKIIYYGFPYSPIKRDSNGNLLHGRVCYKGNEHILCIPRNAPYGINMTTAIWEKTALLNVLNDGIKTAWDVENYFLMKAQIQSGGYYENCVEDDGSSIRFSHMIKKGKWIKNNINNISASGIFIDYKKRGFVPLSSQIRTLIVGAGNRIIPVRYRRVVKRILSKVGFHFATQY